MWFPSASTFPKRALAGLLAALTVGATAPAGWAEPRGERVVHGNVRVSRRGDVTVIRAGAAHSWNCGTSNDAYNNK